MLALQLYKHTGFARVSGRPTGGSDKAKPSWRFNIGNKISVESAINAIQKSAIRSAAPALCFKVGAVSWRSIEGLTATEVERQVL